MFSNHDYILCFIGGNRVTYAVTGAHEGPIFSLSVLSDGTMLSGGGKDRKVIQWDSSYQATVQLEVRRK